MILLDNEYLKVGLDDENKLLTLDWTTLTAQMPEAIYQETMIKLAEFVEQYQVKKWMGNTLNFALAITPNLQEWTVENFSGRIVAAGLTKMALIVPQEFISNLAVQQTVDEMQSTSNPLTFEIRYFDDLLQAKKWLLE